MLGGPGYRARAIAPEGADPPSCGAGGVLTEPLAERVLYLLRQLSLDLRGRD